MATRTDMIEKQVVLSAPIERVWRAISDSAEFGRWFGARFTGPFEAGRKVEATIVPTEVDPEVARTQEPYRDLTFPIWVEKVEPPRHLSFRWQPGGAEPVGAEPNGAEAGPGEAAKSVATSQETTLVSFDLEETSGGTRLTIRESGFDAIPLERRARALADNEQGWEIQTTLVARYLADNA